MTAPFTVADYMSVEVITLTPDMDILHAGSLLLEHDISAAPVVDTDGKLLGIITERDFFKSTIQAGYYDQLGGKVSEYMSNEVVTVSPDLNILELAEIFLTVKYHRYPVTIDGKLLGVISRRDVLRAIHSLSWPQK